MQKPCNKSGIKVDWNTATAVNTFQEVCFPEEKTDTFLFKWPWISCFSCMPSISWPHFRKPHCPMSSHLMANQDHQLPCPPGYHRKQRKMHNACQTTSRHHQRLSVWGSLGRGEAEMKCGSHRRCWAASYVFSTPPGAWPTCSPGLYMEVNRMLAVGERWCAICSPIILLFWVRFALHLIRAKCTSSFVSTHGTVESIK